ncbi:hypothetical protein [Hymenobacter volaticus]|uniref:DUF2490 domain-containing protein n=1 Tax=Hymenobacter volaticus TaxID=2932254 RepID=A0ABY4GDM6_9BACT|nr:hypothetical protein [Hymenobacter volaticus]UOQ68957.1 hypothetical protein MUN86_24955 [Hymenobacter volaticus]
MQRFLFLFLLLSRAAMSQTPDSVATSAIPPKSNSKFGIVSSISFAVATTSTPNLRSYFRANQIKPAPSFGQFAHWNGGFRYKRLKFMSQGGRGLDLTLSEAHYGNKREAQLNHADYVGTMLGYDVLNGRNRRIYLNVGSGTILYKYSVYRFTLQHVDWQDLTQYNQPGNIPSLRLTNRYLDFNVEFVQREKRKRSAEYLLRAGYRRGLRPKAWQSDAFVLQGAPTDRISQFYLQLGYNFSLNFDRVKDL